MVQNVYEETRAIFDNAGSAAADPVQGEQSYELEVITGEQLMNYPFRRREYLVDHLLQDGLTVLAGSPKVGKSWLVLHLCLQVCAGGEFLGNRVKRGDVLYLALEDTPRRLNERMSLLTDTCGGGLYVSTHCHPLGEGLLKELRNFIRNHPLTRLIVIDTFQKVRKAGKEMSYANDYSDVSRLKQLADDNHICILLVHHTRKMADNDYMNEISGTNGIAGSADALMVLKRESRSSRSATLSCTGRDIEDREFKLTLDKESCLWQVNSDSRDKESHELPEELCELVEYMKEIGEFEGSNSDFVKGFCDTRGYIINANHLKRSMNRHRDALAEQGVEFISGKKDRSRVLGVVYYDRKPDDTNAADDDQPIGNAENQPINNTAVEPVNNIPVQPDDDPTQGSLNQDADYMESLLNDDAYIPRTSLSEVDLEEEQSLWDQL